MHHTDNERTPHMEAMQTTGKKRMDNRQRASTARGKLSNTAPTTGELRAWTRALKATCAQRGRTEVRIRITERTTNRSELWRCGLLESQVLHCGVHEAERLLCLLSGESGPVLRECVAGRRRQARALAPEAARVHHAHDQNTFLCSGLVGPSNDRRRSCNARISRCDENFVVIIDVCLRQRSPQVERETVVRSRGSMVDGHKVEVGHGMRLHPCGRMSACDSHHRPVGSRICIDVNVGWIGIQPGCVVTHHEGTAFEFDGHRLLSAKWADDSR
mmetsp:Transcript_55674/g.111633  ORF Transcript_55674/g.111633 Transcript_55674/m.111633 type:complete len:273 (+) Transcript_55674:105-923(+)